jgi:hypothetical protein
MKKTNRFSTLLIALYLLLFHMIESSCQIRKSQLPNNAETNLFAQTQNAVFVLSIGDVASRKMLDCWIGLKSTKVKGTYEFDFSSPTFFTKRFVYRERLFKELEDRHLARGGPGWLGEVVLPLASALGTYGALHSTVDPGWVTTLFLSWTAASGTLISARHLSHVHFTKELEIVNTRPLLMLLNEEPNPVPQSASKEFFGFLQEVDEVSGQNSDSTSRNSGDPLEGKIREKLRPKEHLCASAYEPWKQAHTNGDSAIKK